jgi:hypothetical protein
MLISRMMIAGAVVMVGTFVAGPVRAGCDPSFPLTCLGASDHAADATRDAAAAHSPHAIKRQARAAKTFDRRRKHADARKARHVRTAKAKPPRATPAAQQGHVPMSASARRFGEFVNPRSIVVNPVDELKRPRPDGADLTTSITVPTVATRLQPAIGAAVDDATFSQDEINELDLAAVAEARPIKVDFADVAVDGGNTAVPARVVEVRGPVSPDQAPASMTWLQLIFVTWGGILTVASAVRLSLG